MGKVSLAALCMLATLGCVKDRECRDGTVMLTFDFADASERVDGVALRYRLDGAELRDIGAWPRPAGAKRANLELEVRQYSSHTLLAVEYGATKGGALVSPWWEAQVPLAAGCTVVVLRVAAPVDGGGAEAAAVDVAARPDSADTEVRTLDAIGWDAVMNASGDAGASVPDVPLPSVDDAAVDSPIAADLASDGVRLPPVDAPIDVTIDVAIDTVFADAQIDGAAGYCLIDSVAHAPDATQSGNPCHVCKPATSASSWTRAANGTGCGSGQVCADGLCRAGCWVEGTFYQAAVTKPGNTCQLCNPVLNVATWTVEKDGTSCGNGQGCSAGQCGAGCWIDGAFYPSGAAKAGSLCQTCQPGTSTSTWTPVPNGGSCGAGQICDAASCVAGCFIDGAFTAPGAPKTGDPCQTCQPATSVSSWSNAPGGTACGAGQICNAGACSVACWIASAYYDANAKKSGNSCLSCQPGQTTTDWTKAADGVACGTGQVCGAGVCKAGCWIDAVFYPQGADRPGNPCQGCQTATTTMTWTNKDNGTACGNGQQCNAGICGDGCNIGGTFYATGTKKPGNECQSCQPGVSATVWTDVAAGGTCETTRVCSTGVCGDCVPGTTKCKDASIQQLCRSDRTWSDNTACPFGCRADAGTCYPVCTPGTVQCVSTSQPPQQCAPTGTEWTDLAACASGSECVGAGICLKSNGQACDLAAECATSVCNLYYYDGDGDGYYGSASKYCGASPPTGWKTSASGADCCDSDDRARPGQATGYATANTCGTFDYDCDGVITKLPETYVPSNGACGNCWCFWNTYGACQSNEALPACGQGSVSYWYCGPYGNEHHCTESTMPCR